MTSAQKIVAEALEFADQKRKEGWTREDFAKALGEMLGTDNPDELIEGLKTEGESGADA